METVIPELGFYALAGQPKSPRDLIAEVQAGEAMGLGTVFLSERYNSKEIGAISGAAAAASESIRIATASRPRRRSPTSASAAASSPTASS